MAKQNAITFTAYATKNLCYQAAQPMPDGTPAGIIIHSTGANNAYLRRYVDAPEICGENKYGNHWNVPMPIGGKGKPTKICCHAFIGKDKDETVRAAKILPWDICCWNCGDGAKGSYNYSPAYIQIEICEDDLTDKKYFEEAFALAAQLCKRLMKNYDIPVENVISHKEAHARGYASNHADCDHWLKKFGKDMDWFRSLLVDKPAEEQYTVTGTKIVKKSQLAQTEGPLKALGFEVTTQKI